jgi:hypothetical protein
MSNKLIKHDFYTTKVLDQKYKIFGFLVENKIDLSFFN